MSEQSVVSKPAFAASLHVTGTQNRGNISIEARGIIAENGAIQRNLVFHIAGVCNRLSEAILSVTADGQLRKATITPLSPGGEKVKVAYGAESVEISTDYKKASKDIRPLVLSAVTKALELMGLTAVRVSQRIEDPEIAELKAQVAAARAKLAALRVAKGLSTPAAKSPAKSPAKK